MKLVYAIRGCAVVFLFTACTYARTQTVVDLRADRTVETQASELRLEVRDGTGATVFERLISLSATDFRGFPIEIPIAAKRGDESRSFELRATAVQARRQSDGSSVTSTLAQNRVRTSFRRGQVLRFTLWLLSGCRCSVESERCEPDADGDLVPECVPIALDVNPMEAGVADSANDASVDGVVSETGPMCTAQQRLCGAQCVSRNSPVACGVSCVRCESVTSGEPICENDACDVRCAASTPDHCPSACVDLDSDRANCGVCGRACAQGQLCVSRICVAPPQCTMAQDATCTGQTYCNLATRMCTPGCDGRNGQCPLGQMCNTQSNTCVCADGTRRCGNACATCPTGANIANVGCEGNACIVQSCGAGFTRNSANTSCVDINECSVNNGGCGVATCSNSDGSFSCSCSAPNRMCGGSCVACPSDVNATATVCGANLCVISSCGSGFRPNGAGVVCEPTGPPRMFTGAPVAIRLPSGGSNTFGTSVSLSQDGNTLVVGDATGGADQNGSATVYTRTGGAWSAGINVRRPIGAYRFGRSVSVSPGGNTVAVGDSGGGGDRNGSATVYSDGAWNAGVDVTRPIGASDFGRNVLLAEEGNTLAVGDPTGGDGSRGSVTVYTRSSTTWSAGANLMRPSSAFQFGWSIGLSQDGNTLAVGDNFAAGNPRGSVMVYVRSGGAWGAGTGVTGSSTAIGFGASVSLSHDGNTLAVGDNDGSEIDRGSANLYSRSTGIWSPGTNLMPPSGAYAVGWSASLSGDGNTLVVGDVTGNGAYASVYSRSGGVWTAGTNVTLPTGGLYHFGTSVALSGDGNTLAVGDYRNNAVSVYTR